MDKEASTSHPSSGLSASGALSHVYIENTPINCSIPESKGLFYDDGNNLILSHTSDQVFSWKVAPFNPQVEPTCDTIGEGSALAIRYSLDNKILAVQRSRHEIQLWNKESGLMFTHRCIPGSDSILGFFWTDSPTCNIVLVKTSGLELSLYDAESQILRLVESKRINVSWYVYSHESRLVLLASGMQCKSFTGFQLSSVGIVRLPKFDMLMAKSDANSKPVLAAEDIHVITVYGRVYCLQVDRTAMLLHCFRLYRDAVVQQGSLPIYSAKVAVSVVDSVLLVHQVDAKVVILYDLFAESKAPISAPLPLVLRGPRANINDNKDGSSKLDLTNDQDVTLYSDGWRFLIPDLICDTSSGLLWKIQLDLDAISASSSDIPAVLEFLQRRQMEAQKAKQLCVSLARTIMLERRPVDIVARVLDILITSYSHAIKTGSYFKGKKPEKTCTSTTQHVQSARLSADTFPSRGVPGTESVKIDSMVAMHGQSSTLSDSESDEGKVGSSSGVKTSASKVPSSSLNSQLPGTSRVPLDANRVEQHESQVTTAAISPDEVCQLVFAPVVDEMAGDHVYLVSIIVEYLRSANLERIRMYPNLYVLMIELMARSDRYAELGLFVIDKIIEPSKEVAYQLLESGRQHHPTRKLGFDMLRQLSLHDDYVLSLAQDGYYLEALRYARKHKVTNIQASLFLEAAYTSNDSQRLGAVIRFFSDIIPDFKGTSDYATYSNILHQLNSSAAA